MIRARILRRVAALVFVVMLAVPSLGGAVSVNEISKELRCPTCNTPLDVSNAPIARDMKTEIRGLIDAGATRDAIIAQMVRDFGREVLATPPKEGFDLIAWLVPPILVAGGLVAILLVARTSRRIVPARSGDPEPTDAEAARLRSILGEPDTD